VRDHEPATALRGGPDGLRVITPLVRGAAQWLKPGGRLLVEIAASQGGAVRRLVESCGDLAFRSIERDHEGLDRVLVADRA
jgi:release factor glutamine methyltransferase